MNIYNDYQIVTTLESGNVAEIKKMLERIDVNREIDINCHPIVCNVFMKNTELLELLLSKRANTEVLGFSHRTPIFDFLKNGDVRTLKILLEAGANVNHVDFSGNNAFMHVLCSNFHDCPEMEKPNFLLSMD